MKRISGLLLLLVLASTPLAACGLELHNPVSTGEFDAKIIMKEEVAGLVIIPACETWADASAVPIIQSCLNSNIYMSGICGGFYPEGQAGFYSHPALLGIV